MEIEKITNPIFCNVTVDVLNQWYDKKNIMPPALNA